MNVPPKGALCGRKGTQAGLSAALRALRVGDERDCPLAWGQGCGSAAQRLGIKVVTRRLEDHETVRVYRIE